MTKPFSLATMLAAVCSVLFVSACSSQPKPSAQPNFLWIVSEDNSAHYLLHYFAEGAATPNIEQLAKTGVTFERAYSNAPVCSVARTTLATGMYAPKIGAQYHRAYQDVSLPEGSKLLQQYLQDLGYYTSNRSKTDYNLTVNDKKTWHQSSKKAHWRNRDNDNQPFFHMETVFISHESRLHFGKKDYQAMLAEGLDQNLEIPPYLPQTDTSRATVQHYHALIQRVDDRAGEILAELKEDGQFDNTFVFYLSDHGGVLPRGKGYIYESGTRVPLVVHIPKNFRHLVDTKAGSRVEGIVEFIDLAPTVLKLAGFANPTAMDGTPIFDKANATEGESISYGDRFDEKYDLVRSLHQGDYHYIRSYEPHLARGMFNGYRYKMLAYQEWQQLYAEGKTNAEQSFFFEAKPVEALYNIKADPHELNNLALQPAYQQQLRKMRQRLNQRLKAMPDVGFYPESYLASHAIPKAYDYGQAHKADLARYIDLADLATQPFTQVEASLARALAADDPITRYWALMVVNSFGEQAMSLLPAVKPLLQDKSPQVQHRALLAMARLSDYNPVAQMVRMVNESDDPIFVSEMLNTAVYLRENYDAKYPIAAGAFTPKVSDKLIVNRLAYLNKS